MKLLSFFILIIFFNSFEGDCQKLSANYLVKKEVFSDFGNGMKQKIATLDYRGVIFRQGKQYIYFKVPQYLNNYPTGEISFETGTNRFSTYVLPMDTIQDLNYKSYDSLLYRHRPDYSGRGMVTKNYLQKFEPGFQQWQLLPDTREINGLNCQKARLVSAGTLQWEVWFCADIPMQAGPSNIFDLPGLVVEGENFPVNEKISLISYSTQADIPPSVFWPAEFNQPFETWRTIRKLPASK